MSSKSRHRSRSGQARNVSKYRRAQCRRSVQSHWRRLQHVHARRVLQRPSCCRRCAITPGQACVFDTHAAWAGPEDEGRVCTPPLLLRSRPRYAGSASVLRPVSCSQSLEGRVLHWAPVMRPVQTGSRSPDRSRLPLQRPHRYGAAAPRLHVRRSGSAGSVPSQGAAAGRG